MRKATIPALYTAATGNNPHTATLVNPICYSQAISQALWRATGTTQPALWRDWPTTAVFTFLADWRRQSDGADVRLLVYRCNQLKKGGAQHDSTLRGRTRCAKTGEGRLAESLFLANQSAPHVRSAAGYKKKKKKKTKLVRLVALESQCTPCLLYTSPSPRD